MVGVRVVVGVSTAMGVEVVKVGRAVGLRCTIFKVGVGAGVGVGLGLGLGLGVGVGVRTGVAVRVGVGVGVLVR